MVGKGSLIVILGFSMIFGLAGQYWNRMSTDAMENFANYYDSTAAHNIAISAANILADSIFWNSSAANMSTTSPFTFNGGTFTLRTQYMVVNGDSDVLATVASSYNGFRGHVIKDSVQILLHPARFSEYAYFTNNDNNVNWITGEVMNGPYHTNGRLLISGSPTFLGSVTTGTGLATPYANPVNPSSLPDSHGDRLNCASYQSGVIIPLPTSLAQYTSIPGTVIFNNTDTHTSYNYDFYATFSSTDPTKISFHTELKNGATMVTRVPASGDSTIPISTLGGGASGSGVVVIQNGDIHISGNMNGDITFVAQAGTRTSLDASASGSGGFDLSDANGNSHNGNIIIEGGITYANNPVTNPASTNMLGLVADNSIMIKKQTTQNLAIQAALFARSGSFFYQDYNQGSSMGTLNILGSVGQSTRGAVNTNNSGTVVTGYKKNYLYDTRFASTAPPYFPTTGKFNILSWRE
ncbi:MAG TPA: hypothetical protein VIS48_08565 [Candidatus Kryptonia bacterium]